MATEPCKNKVFGFGSSHQVFRKGCKISPLGRLKPENLDTNINFF